MSRESLLVIASEMLHQTNVFPKDVSELKYASPWQEEDITLLGCLKLETQKYDHRFRGKSERNLQTAYRCIAAAMVVYLESYPAVFSFKQQTKELFRNWLIKIRQAYAIADTTEPAELMIGTKERDTGIAMLKLLHARSGVGMPLSASQTAPIAEISPNAEPRKNKSWNFPPFPGIIPTFLAI